MHELGAGFEFILRGGFMMYPLLLSGLIGLTVIFERLFVYRRRFSTPRDVIETTLTHLRAGRIDQAKGACDSLRTPTAAVLASGIAHFADPAEQLELAMKNRAEEWMPHLERRLEVLDTVITAAPLMGLLGTITGMMGSFRVLSEKGVNEPNSITGGVAEALIATATGLVVALLCLLFFNYFNSRVKDFIYEMESAASRLLEARMAHARDRK